MISGPFLTSSALLGIPGQLDLQETQHDGLHPQRQRVWFSVLGSVEVQVEVRLCESKGPFSCVANITQDPGLWKAVIRMVCWHVWMDGCMHACMHATSVMYGCMHVCMYGCMHACMHA